jgi:uncharacterized protein YkwD
LCSGAQQEGRPRPADDAEGVVFKKAFPCALAAAALLVPAASADVRGCADANASIARAGVSGQTHAMRCLINWARASHGLRRLRESPRLDRAATRHSSDMVRRRYFEHVSPGGGGLVRRARRAGYHGIHLGEAIAWGTGGYATAAMTVSEWLHSAPHRRILLNPRLRDLGIGISSGTPDAGVHDDGITVTADLGRH